MNISVRCPGASQAKSAKVPFSFIAALVTTLYGAGYMNLRNGPVVLEMPEITDRYFSLQVMDQYGIFHTVVGSPFNGTKARKYLFVPPGHEGKLPGGSPRQESSTGPARLR